MIKRILVGLTGTPYTAVAIRRAVELAQQQQARLTAVTVVDTTVLGRLAIMPGGVPAAVRERERLAVTQEALDKSIAEFESACRDAGVAGQVKRETGEPFGLLVSDARYYDLMIFGLRSVFEYDLVLEPRDALAKLIAGGVRPILAISTEHRPIRRVLIAYSGSVESAKTMKRFIQCRLWPDAQLRIVTFAHEVNDAEQLVGDAADYCRAHGFEPEEACVLKPPKNHLLPYASEWGADLIVVGNSAKSLLLRRVFGETALHAIQNAETPLFLAQ